jgi:hypothetical protein
LRSCGHPSGAPVTTEPERTCCGRRSPPQSSRRRYDALSPQCRRSSDGQSARLVSERSPVRLRPSALDFLPLWYRDGRVLFVRRRPHMTAHGRGAFRAIEPKNGSSSRFSSLPSDRLRGERSDHLSYVGVPPHRTVRAAVVPLRLGPHCRAAWREMEPRTTDAHIIGGSGAARLDCRLRGSAAFSRFRDAVRPQRPAGR